MRVWRCTFCGRFNVTAEPVDGHCATPGCPVAAAYEPPPSAVPPPPHHDRKARRPRSLARRTPRS